jgi:very-short-patch-repair endonuclease
MRPTVKRCDWCGAELSLRRDPRTRLCNGECKVLGKRRATYSEAVRQKRSEQMRKLNERPDVREKLIAFRASDRCPVKLPENRRKLVEGQRALGFPNLNYRGGPTAPQKILFDALPGAAMEFRFLGSGRESGKVSRLSIDVAIPSLKLAIEVDGLSHVRQLDKARDSRKEQALKERGWTLLRFRNGEVLNDLSSVLSKIQDRIAMLRGAA